MDAVTTNETTRSSTSRKRNPYTTTACQECQRRKIKCSGDKPCKGCSLNHSSCVYDKTTRFRRTEQQDSTPSTARRILPVTSTLPDRVAGEQTLFSKPARASRKVSSSQGIASKNSDGSVYSDSHLRTPQHSLDLTETLSPDPSPTGTTTTEDAASTSTIQGHRIDTTQILRHVVRVKRSNGASPGTLLGAIAVSQWLEIIDSFEDEIGFLYPIISFESLRARIHANQEATEGLAYVDEHLGETLSIMMATTAVLQDPDITEVSDFFVEEAVINSRRRTQMHHVGEHDLIVMTLLSIYHFMADREVLAWRTIGSVMRMLQELRYHTSARLNHRFPSQEGRYRAKLLFWSVYILDHRWSSGTGLPFAIHDSDIDHDLDDLQVTSSKDNDDDSWSSEYIKAMIMFCRVGTEVQATFLTLPTTSKSATVDGMRDLLDFKVVSWQQNLPASLQFRFPQSSAGGSGQSDGDADGSHDHIPALSPEVGESRGHYRLRLILYLRANQMRIMIHRKSALRLGPHRMLNTSTINTLIRIAQDTIRVHVGLARGTSGIYQSQQRTFNHFLESAVSSLLMVNCRPGKDNDRSSMQEVRLAMELVRTLIPNSPIMRRLHSRLEALATRNGYPTPAPSSNQEHTMVQDAAAQPPLTETSVLTNVSDATGNEPHLPYEGVVANSTGILNDGDLDRDTGSSAPGHIVNPVPPWQAEFFPFLLPPEIAVVSSAGSEMQFLDHAHGQNPDFADNLMDWTTQGFTDLSEMPDFNASVLFE